MSATPVIEVEKVCFSYGGPVPALEEVDFTIPEGDFVSVIGPNGGGKTTLLRLLLGLLQPSSGRIRVLGRGPVEARPLIGYMPQHAQLDPRFPVSVLDVVLMGRLGHAPRLGPFRSADRQAALDALRMVGIADLCHRSFAALSGGQRQRVLIARALACRPRLLMLDEPTANLDIGVQDDFHQLLREMNRSLTLLIVSHDVGFVATMVKTVVCVNRRVAVHPTGSITGEMISEMYGREVGMVLHSHGHVRE